jgi:hypothetical protein
MADMIFECQDGYNLEHGTIEVADPDGETPTAIICCNDPWEVNFNWTAKGAQWCMAAGSDGKFRCQIHLELMGAGEFDLADPDGDGIEDNATHLLVPIEDSDNEDYEDKTIQIDANQVPPGLYKLVAVLTADWDHGGVREPIPAAGFIEGIMLHFYDQP